MKTLKQIAFVLIVASVVASPFAANCQTWSPLQSFPANMGRKEAVSFAVGNKIYVATGRQSGVPLNDNWEYNPNTNSWAQKQPTNFAARSGAIALVINGVAYVGTGDLSTNANYPSPASDFFVYNSASDLWDIRLSVGATGRFRAVSFTVGNKGYVGFGAKTGGAYSHIGASEKSFLEYDPNVGPLGTWTQKAYPKLAPGVIGAQGFSINGKGYITGGYTPGYEIDQMYAATEGATSVVTRQYDPGSNTWTRKADLPANQQRHYSATIVLLDRAYLVGGNISGIDPFGGHNSWVDNNFWNNTLKYNPYLNTWVVYGGTNPFGNATSMEGISNCDYGYVTAGRLIGGSYNYSNYQYSDVLDGNYLSGPGTVCASGTFPFTLQLSASGSLTWTTSSNIYLVAGQATNSVIVNAYSGASGPGWVKCTYNNGCRTIDFVKNLDQVGPFNASQIIVSGQAAVCPGNFYNYYAITPPGASAYSWTFPSSWILQGQSSNYITLFVPEGNTQYGTVMVSVTNSCGTSSFTGITVYPGYSCGGCCSMAFSPNPAQDELVVEVNEKGDKAKRIDSAFESTLYDNNGTTLKSASSRDGQVTFDVRTLKDGEYYIRATSGDWTEARRVWIKH